ncbi:MAG: hypothetical protein DSO09_01035 [Candidatus Methanomethylicota archaeon]|uniref:Uncharacterized protein n=1 Tax=Thermoproteota archaeon TaxID=2056631 RepID=A0A523BGZ2_9CREN|nr:MAG: hypothetical protein DSO09_01035 [Candidatus Verstraetearchaeota archaeon]
MKGIKMIAIISILALFLAISLVFNIMSISKPKTTTTTVISEKIEEKTYTITLTNIQYSTITHTYTIPPTTFTTTVPTTITTLITITTKIKEDFIILADIGTGDVNLRAVYGGDKDRIVNSLNFYLTPIYLGNENLVIDAGLIRVKGVGIIDESPDLVMVKWQGAILKYLIKGESMIMNYSPSSPYRNALEWVGFWGNTSHIDLTKVSEGAIYTIIIPYKINNEWKITNATVRLEKIRWLPLPSKF